MADLDQSVSLKDHVERISRENRFSLVVGINSGSSRHLPVLTSAEKDATELSQILERPACSFESTLLKGNDANSRDIKRAIGELLKNKAEKDFLLFYYIGHAKIIEVEGHYDAYFISADFIEADLEVDKNMHVSMRWLKEKLYEFDQAGRVLIVLDCCHSGYIAQIDINEIVRASIDGPSVSLQNGHVRIIFTSTSYDQSAYEKADHALMSGLFLSALKGEKKEVADKDGRIDAFNMYKYIQRELPKEHFPNFTGKITATCILAEYPELASDSRVDVNNPEIGAKLDKLIALQESGAKTASTNGVSEQIFDHTLCPGLFIDHEHLDEYLDMDIVATFFDKPRTRKDPRFKSGLSSEKLMERFGFLQGGLITYGALLCFGRDPQRWVTSARVDCTRWFKTVVQGESNGEKFTEGLLKQYDKSLLFLKNNLSSSLIISRDGREEVLEMSNVVLQEALANALVHRNYANTKGFIQVEIHDAWIKFLSPGDLPDYMSVEQIGVEATSHPRNPQIADIFYCWGHIEEKGKGFIRMQDVMREEGFSPPEFKVTTAKTFSVTLYRRQNIPQEYIRSDEFAELLSQGIDAIALALHKKVEEVEDELRKLHFLDASSSLKNWKEGIIPPGHDQIVSLARACARVGKMKREWLNAFLQATHYPASEALISELYPQNFWNELRRITRNATNATRVRGRGITIFFFFLLFNLFVVLSINNNLYVTFFLAFTSILSIGFFEPIFDVFLYKSDAWLYNIFRPIIVYTNKRIQRFYRISIFTPLFSKNSKFLRRGYILLVLEIIIIILNAIISPSSSNSFFSGVENELCFTTQIPISSIFCSNGIGTIHMADNVTIGLLDEDHATPFDQSNLNSEEKNLEHQIFAENHAILSANVKHITLIVMTTLSRTVEDSSISASSGLNDLRGAYLAQKDYNAGTNHSIKLRLLIANVGVNQTALQAAPQVTEQIILFAKKDTTFRGIIGLSSSTATSKVLTTLQSLHESSIPVISPSATSDILSNIPNFYRVVSSDRVQAIDVADFIVRQIKPAYVQKMQGGANTVFTVAVLSDPRDVYSHNLAESFIGALPDLNLMKSNGQYVAGNADSIMNAAKIALEQHASLIFFAGNENDLEQVQSSLQSLENQSQLSSIPIFGGDELYANGFLNTHYSPVYAITNASLLEVSTAFKEDFAATFNTNAQNSPSLLPQVILTYDATKAFLSALNTLNTDAGAINSVEDFNSELAHNSFQGVSGQITFENDEHSSNSVSANLSILCVDKNNTAHTAATYNAANQATFDFIC